MLTIDHVVLAGDDHAALVDAVADVGLPSDYGGVHATGTTQMSVVGFPDGSYLELIGPADGVAPAEADYWPARVAADAGPAAWCVLVDDVAETAVRHVRAGVPVDGPHHAGRERPDGTRVEWDMVFAGDGELLPFAITDRTPRRDRVTPTAGLADGPLAGVAEVVLAVPDRDAASELARVHRFPDPRRFEHGRFDAVLHAVPGQPVTLAVPDADSPLAARLDDFGPSPCAYLFGTDDLDAALDAYPLHEAGRWGGRRVAFFDGLDALGVIEPPEGGVASAGPDGR